MAQKWLLASALLLLAVFTGQIQGQMTAEEERLVNWVLEEGATLRVTIGRRPDGVRGLFTTQAVAKGDLLVYIPDHIVLSVKNVAASEAAPTLLKELHVPCSRLRPYLDVLPKENEVLTGYNFPVELRWEWPYDAAACWLIAGIDLGPGEEVTISYGNLRSDDLLLYYGFLDTQTSPPRLLAVDHPKFKPYESEELVDDPHLAGSPQDIEGEMARLRAVQAAVEERLAALGPVPDHIPYVAGLMRALHEQRRHAIRHELERLQVLLAAALTID
ncbi:hypothetical protein TSOC_009281, partial [Tetrabaena socialis]